MEKVLKGRGYRSCVNSKCSRNKTLGGWARHANRIRSRVRVRVEHVFGAQSKTWEAALL